MTPEQEDELAKKMADAIDAIPAHECRGKSSRQLCETFARAALAIAKPVLRDEALEEAAMLATTFYERNVTSRQMREPFPEEIANRIRSRKSKGQKLS